MNLSYIDTSPRTCLCSLVCNPIFAYTCLSLFISAISVVDSAVLSLSMHEQYVIYSLIILIKKELFVVGEHEIWTAKCSKTMNVCLTMHLLLATAI